MKNFAFTKIVITCFFITSFLCIPPLLSSFTGNSYFNGGVAYSKESIKIVIEGAERKTVEQEWRKLMRSHGGKVSSRRRVWTSEGTNISSISDHPMMVIANIENTRKGVEISVQFKHADADVSLLQDDNVKKAAEKFVNDFTVKVKISSKQELINQTKKELKSIERDKRKLERENKKLEKRIKNAEKTIENSKKDIEKNKNTIKEKESESKKINDKIKDLEKEVRRLK